LIKIRTGIRNNPSPDIGTVKSSVTVREIIIDKDDPIN
jgi:hypothetical protein